jgi:hypothetical protein
MYSYGSVGQGALASLDRHIRKRYFAPVSNRALLGHHIADCGVSAPSRGVLGLPGDRIKREKFDEHAWNLSIASTREIFGHYKYWDGN